MYRSYTRGEPSQHEPECAQHEGRATPTRGWRLRSRRSTCRRRRRWRSGKASVTCPRCLECPTWRPTPCWPSWQPSSQLTWTASRMATDPSAMATVRALLEADQSTDFPYSMNVCGGAPASGLLTRVLIAPRAQVVEKLALGGLAAATPREPAETCYGGWVLSSQLAYDASNLGRGLKIRD